MFESKVFYFFGTQRILDKIRKYFNPLVSGPGRLELWKKSKLDVEISLDCPFKLKNWDLTRILLSRYSVWPLSGLVSIIMVQVMQRLRVSQAQVTQYTV